MRGLVSVLYRSLTELIEKSMHHTAELWLFSMLQYCPIICCVSGMVVVMGVFLLLPPLCCVLPTELCPGGQCGGGGTAPVELWIEVKRGWGLASRVHTPSIPNTSESSPSFLFPLASRSAQTVTIHAWREVGSGWLEMYLSLSLALLCCFFLSCYTFVLISFSLSHTDFSWESQNDRGPFSRNWSADVEKMRQRHTVSWFSSTVNYQ